LNPRWQIFSNIDNEPRRRHWAGIFGDNVNVPAARRQIKLCRAQQFIRRGCGRRRGADLLLGMID